MTKIVPDDLNPSDELFEHYRIVVDRGQTPIRIDKFLMDRLERVSRNRIQSAIKAHSVLVDESSVKPNHKVKPGSVITIVLPHPPREDEPIEAEDIHLNIVFEDSDLLVVNKIAGMVVHPGISNHSGTLVNALAWHLNDQKLPVQAGNPVNRPGLVHRIDKNTSGLLVIAKNESAMSQLSRQFFDHSIKREYIALVWGSPDPEHGKIEANIGRHPKDRLRMTVFPEGNLGKRAVTHYQVLEDLYYVSLIQCHLETGRTHQIRVHLSSLGHPVFNDERYGGDRIVKGTVFSKFKQFVQNNFNILPRHGLHAKSLGFIHPSTGKSMYFDSEVPEDMAEVLERWRNYIRQRKKG